MVSPSTRVHSAGHVHPHAEQTPLIDDITKWVIGAALADKAAWNTRGHSLALAMNISAHNLHERSLLETLQETVSRHRIDPHEVELEVTESAVMGDFEYCTTLIRRLRDQGFRVSIDDFGTGQSSLAYLKKLPVCALKIDQAFIRGLVDDRSGQKIVRTILDLARSLTSKTSRRAWKTRPHLHCSANGAVTTPKATRYTGRRPMTSC